MRLVAMLRSQGYFRNVVRPLSWYYATIYDVNIFKYDVTSAL